MTVTLLGGSGLGPWAWQRVVPLLHSRGIRTRTPRLRPTASSLTDWIDDATDPGGTDVTLVAHSFAGYVAAGLLARDPARISTVVFLDAVLPQPGRSWFDVMGPDVEAYLTYAEPAIAEPLDPTRTRLVYIRCLRTTPPAAAVDGTGWTVHPLDAGHWPMVTRPEETARLIGECAGRP
ncbi:alpha/beta fold hydrolase [Virgisporangium aurantiacum]|uniref:AB hydrolase-1 domain-containing protein n=1 Tax=Virgisporangium aurantiacum TaxID=175570 RepID=A0A8J3ZC78_9ACTN|nr:alpha/beta hydrolase [Virgisporangium aurantiacum]GIJ61291.1 hypothetical protein Vau01_088070 [Virgisporangium aurantiacum]